MPPRLWNEVASEVLDQELVVGQIGIERSNYVVAISPGVVQVVVEFEAERFAVADDIEPVTAKTFAIAGRGEQAIDQSLIHVGRVVGEKRIDFVGQRREAGQIECQATDESALGGGRRWLKPGGFQARADENVDRFLARIQPRGSGVFGGGWLAVMDR